jgi:transcriptional regulator with XRE-family HTH domain
MGIDARFTLNTPIIVADWQPVKRETSQMATIGQRLREERHRLGLNQADFSAVAGQKKHSQIRYEADERLPDGNYLRAISDFGADVLYILTGKKAVGGVAEDPSQYQMGLSEPEKALLRNFRICGDSDRAVIERLADALAKDTFP